ncbi:MAG: prolipoprotein diacylglyceryl transferase family protein [Candidatus Promineifilaceae bacterium]
MAPILARYDSIFIYTFTVVLALGVSLAVYVTAELTRRRPAPAWFDALLWTFAAAIAGGRLGFILGQWSYFQENPLEIWQVWRGGLSYHGALLAGLAGLLLWSMANDRSFYRYAALFAPGLALIAVFGWAACWFDGCAYGRETIIGPLAADLPDTFGVFALRFRTQLAGLLLSVIAFGLILWLSPRLPDAQLFCSALLLLSLAHLLPGLYRGDPLLSIGRIRLDLLLDALLVLSAVSALTVLQYSARRPAY